MNKEIQIEQMTKITCQMFCGDKEKKCAGVQVCDMKCLHYQRCEVLYNAGYRKRSENTVDLPFKVGDTVYVPWRWAGQRAVATVKVEEIKFYDSQMHYMFLIDMESDNECFNRSFGGWKTDVCIGKTVFLSREGAEKALAERNDGKDT